MMHKRCHSSWVILWALVGAGLTLLILGVSGCSSSSRMELIGVAAEGKGFVEVTSGRPYVPFGTNYYDPNTGWPPKVWQQFDAERVAEHFEILNALGASCARVFLTAATFQPKADVVDEGALEKLDELIKIARRAGVRLLVTGPCPWEGEPAYWQPDRFAGDEALKALEHFWTVVGQRYQGEPAIFAWDLANEPEMPWSVPSWGPLWNEWLQSKYANQEGLKTAWGDELLDSEQMGSVGMPDDVADSGNPRLHDWQLFREHLADRWVQCQVQALRAADPTHLITIGYIQWSYPVVRPGDPSLYSAFNPRRQSQWLDFISMHFYPLMGRPFGSRDNWLKNLTYLQTLLAYCTVGRPVVLEEYGWYGGGAPPDRPFLDEDQQQRWIAAEIEASRPLAQGWLSWPFADTPEATDMAMFGGLLNKNMQWKRWAWHFRSYAANLSILSQPAPELPSFDVSRSLTAPLNDLVPMYDEYAKLIETAMDTVGPITAIPLMAEPVLISEDNAP